MKKRLVGLLTEEETNMNEYYVDAMNEQEEIKQLEEHLEK
jgi:hypothetical protein